MVDITKLTKGQQIRIDVSPIIEREGDMGEYRHGHIIDVSITSIKDKYVITTYEYYEEFPEKIYPEQIIEIL